MPLSRRDFVRTLFVASQTALASRLLADNTPAPIEAAEKTLNFAVIGDWGRWGRTDQTQVANQMAIACEKAAASFIISLGDNFYDYGVTSINDHLWQESFEKVYTARSLQAPWHVILGNHDYCGNCDAQIEYSKIHPRWNMPARYYSQVHDIDPATKLEIFYIDTSPFILDYQKPDSCMYQNVISQDTNAQLAWLEKSLAASTAQWKLVMGHHPIYSSGLAHGNQPEMIEYILPLLQKYKVPAYFAGHDHDLEHLKVGDIDLIVSGGGSEHRPMKEPATSPFSRAVSGFVMASITPHKLEVRFIDNFGHLLYTASFSRTA